MNKVLLVIASVFLLSGCSPELTKEAAQVRSHNQVNKLLDGCKKLGQVTDDYEVKTMLNLQENKTQARNNLKQKAYDNFYADNIVILSSRYVEGGFGEKAMIHGRAVAYRCDRD